MLPPYESEEQRALADDYADGLAHGAFGWTREEAWRYYSAGGGSADEFDGAWERRVAENRAQVDAMADGTFHSAGGQILYLVSGRKPA
jgi:hypothetical protein